LGQTTLFSIIVVGDHGEPYPSITVTPKWLQNMRVSMGEEPETWSEKYDVMQAVDRCRGPRRTRQERSHATESTTPLQARTDMMAEKENTETLAGIKFDIPIDPEEDMEVNCSLMQSRAANRKEETFTGTRSKSPTRRPLRPTTANLNEEMSWINEDVEKNMGNSNQLSRIVHQQYLINRHCESKGISFSNVVPPPVEIKDLKAIHYADDVSLVSTTALSDDLESTTATDEYSDDDQISMFSSTTTDTDEGGTTTEADEDEIIPQKVPRVVAYCRQVEKNIAKLKTPITVLRRDPTLRVREQGTLAPTSALESALPNMTLDEEPTTLALEPADVCMIRCVPNTERQGELDSSSYPPRPSVKCDDVDHMIRMFREAAGLPYHLNIADQRHSQCHEGIHEDQFPVKKASQKPGTTSRMEQVD
jgi:hypothetical protein